MSTRYAIIYTDRRGTGCSHHYGEPGPALYRLTQLCCPAKLYRFNGIQGAVVSQVRVESGEVVGGVEDLGKPSRPGVRRWRRWWLPELGQPTKPDREPRDFQRSAVYRWESRIFATAKMPQLTWAGCQELLLEVWRDYRTDRPPSLRAKSGRGGWASFHTIRLGADVMRADVVIHEAAHVILLREKRCDGHGPRFARFVLELYARYLGVDRVRAERLGISQKPRRVRFASRRDVPQRIGR